MTVLSGWGRYPQVETEIINPRTSDAIRSVTQQADGGVARGNGRAYGDAAIGTRQTFFIGRCDRIRAFDAASGLVTVEAGALLSDLIATFGPRGFLPAVVPGTKYVSVGGAIASDVHGKNHHRDGGFGRHVESMVLVTPNGELMCASQSENAELFAATTGGMGLTGTIVEATLRLRRVETGWIRQKTVVASDLDAAIAALDTADSSTYSVAWIDCLAKGAALGRSLIFQGEHAGLDELGPKQAENPFPRAAKPLFSVPFDFPGFTLNQWSIRAFNEAYFRRGAQRAGAFFLVPADAFFFPLDGIAQWNRIYGKSGFVQHQSIIPTASGPKVLAEMLGRIAARGAGSFLAVLKKLGASEGLLSFPLSGYTLALDFPMKPGLLAFLDELDELVIAAGGRLYLAKDARQSRATFDASYAGLPSFRYLRQRLDPHHRIQSHLAQRLNI
jgi:decaprenylphospho-beta-D-ribofuranose 2-oxidase